MQIKNEAEQVTWSDLGTWYGKTFPERCPPTKEKTSAVYSKRPQKLPKKMPLYLDLRRGGGITADVSWETGGRLLGEYMMHSFGESPKEENESHLSQILEEEVLPKYYLSARACQGILNRASKRGKELPKVLKEALENQINEMCDSED